MSVIHTATIHQQGGGNFILENPDPAKLKQRLAEYCHNWWKDLHVRTPPPLDDDNCIAMYFDKHPHETVTHLSYDDNSITPRMRELVASAVTILKAVPGSIGDILKLTEELENAFGLTLPKDE